jgi:hypothetical protein
MNSTEPEIKSLFCSLGFHKILNTEGIGPVVICRRCKKVIRKRITLFSKENFVIALMVLILAVLLWIMGVMKGCFSV